VDFYQELTNLTGALEAGAVDYALCGGVALAIHGVPRATQVVSRDALIALKLAAGRPQDLVDVQRLKEMNRG
jgi:hypothetical protein